MADCHYSNLGSREVRSPISAQSAIYAPIPKYDRPFLPQVRDPFSSQSAP
ncbi:MULTISPECIES: hypothetical protein [unclassified Microcoleus]